MLKKYFPIVKIDHHPYKGTPYYDGSKSVEYNTYARRNARPSRHADKGKHSSLVLGTSKTVRQAPTKTSKNPVAEKATKSDMGSSGK